MAESAKDAKSAEGVKIAKSLFVSYIPHREAKQCTKTLIH